ncbi:MAG TPA: hypothetical protein DF712_00995 [Balneola sp.]|nr:hypothetical protein [Balneola sp.]|tara:strand:- start:891 stop:1310 length:420 start_codon:yes stop_codon:yes gene_type:complete
MALNFHEVNILGNITNHTYGKASTSGPGSVLSGNLMHVSITSSLQGDVLCVTAVEVVNILDAVHMRQEANRAEEELDQHISKYINNIKKEFKKKENAGRALKCKMIKGSDDTSVEIVGHSAYSPTRPAYIRRRVSYEIG